MQPPREASVAGVPEKFADALVLEVGSDPFCGLVAVKTHEGGVTLFALDAQQQLLGTEEVAPQKNGTMTPFESPALRKTPEARRLRKTCRPGKGAHAYVAPQRKAVVTRRLEKDLLSFYLVTSGDEKLLLTFPEDAQEKVEVWFDSAAKGVILAGWVDTDGKGEAAAVGVLKVIALPSKARPLPRKTIAQILSRESSLFLAADRITDGCKAASAAREFWETPDTLEPCIWCEARNGNWKTSASLLNKLKGMKGKKAASAYARAWKKGLVREAWLRSLPLNSPEYPFKAARAFEGTSVWVKIKDRSGATIAVFKPTNGNTYHRGEVFTWQMAKLLSLEELYPVTILHQLNRAGCRKLIEALNGVEYKDRKGSLKESARKSLIAACKSNRLEGAVKEWVSDFQFLKAIGKVEKLKKHRVYKLLKFTGPWPEVGEKVKVETVTRLYKPDHCAKGIYRGQLDMFTFARDLSDILVMDVLNANEDRFPGANLDFKSVSSAKEIEKCVFDFGESRLFSLDNGATFKGTRSNAWLDMTKNLAISRFHRRTYERLVAIHRFIKDPDSGAPEVLRSWGINSVEELMVYLALDKGDDHPKGKTPFTLFKTNLKHVVEFMGGYADNEDAWFK